MNKDTSATDLGYDPKTLPRETHAHYIPASAEDIQGMLESLGLSKLDELFAHIPANQRFESPPELPPEVAYEQLPARLQAIASRNHTGPSFVGDGLLHFNEHPIIGKVSGIRKLATAYTPYQPERSQGTLVSHWIYQCVLSQLTGFEAINSSLYDRSSAIFEAICTAIRLSRSADTVLIPDAIYPADMEVVETLCRDTEIRLERMALNADSGRINIAGLESKVEALGERLAAIVFPQVNTLGLLENVDALTRLCAARSIFSIAVVDPMLIASGGLKAPASFGDKGTDMIVGEAQHLAISPNFGGPGLGLFGIRHNEEVRNNIRQTPGRYVGKARDESGRDCFVMVLSTREQHIRKDKATSNICSNQAFLASLAGAAILARGEGGMREAVSKARSQALACAEQVTAIDGYSLAFPQAPFFNEFVVECPAPVEDLIRAGVSAGVHIGVDVSERIAGDRHLLKISLTDRAADIESLVEVLSEHGNAGPAKTIPIPEVPSSLLRQQAVGLPEFAPDVVEDYYKKLGELNVSPDEAPYPLGSCTMKYNPYINEWAASLPGFTQVHPQAPLEHVQGCLEVLWEIQEWFKRITGLAAVTTQPVAGAQGELVGIKLFQAYHRARGQEHRDVLFIPDSAHGTNFATAVMAGYRNRKVSGLKVGVVLLKADEQGLIDHQDFASKLETYRDRLAGVMITNPNTTGLFETRFRDMAEAVHEAGGLVYMDGANMNAIAGWCDLGAMGVDAVHNNLHKTWTIPHGGGGPGDAIVAVSERLQDFLPGVQIETDGDGEFLVRRPKHSIGRFHRHWGNFAHKVRTLTYLYRLGQEGVRRMPAMAVLSARYLHHRLGQRYLTLPDGGSEQHPRMHEFILSFSEQELDRIEAAGVQRALVATRVGKLFLDFGYHAPTVAWPEPLGLMIEPTESYTRAELDRFAEAVEAIHTLATQHPEVLHSAPLFTPVDRVDEVGANRRLQLNEPLDKLPALHENRIAPDALLAMDVSSITERILQHHAAASEKATA